ncbi:MAG: hypothetical protein HQK52_12405 [Oligoflexia bacterium]|nr:hypothetical protein [Oligoflexia bacterium]
MIKIIRESWPKLPALFFLIFAILAPLSCDKHKDTPPSTETKSFMPNLSCSFTDGRCWHLVSMENPEHKEEIAKIEKTLKDQCTQEHGSLRQNQLCSSSKETPTCLFTLKERMKMAAFYPLGTTTEDCQNIHQGNLIVPVDQPQHLVAHCDFRSVQQSLCIDYVVNTSEPFLLLKKTCPGDWQEGSRCAVPKDTLGCNLYQKEIGGHQVLWYIGLNKTQMHDHCAPELMITQISEVSP